MNVVLDTNVYISALIFPGGVCDQIFRYAHTKRFDTFVSPDILTELKNVLTRKFKISEDEAVEIVDRVVAVAKLTYPRFRVAEIDTPDADNRILECAMEAHVNFIVTGDKKHILPLKRFKDTRIISPSQFLDLILK